MKKRLIIIVVLLFLVGVGIWFLVFRKSDRYTVGQVISDDALFVVETPSFNSIYDKLCQNKIWASLKTYPSFEAYHAHLNQADSLSKAYPVLRKLLTDRPFAVSCHLISATDYDFLYICDLGKLNVIQALDGIMSGWLEKGQLVKKGELTELDLGGMKMYYAIKANLLLASFSESLVERGIKTCAQPADRPSKTLSGDLMLDLDHQRLEKLFGAIFGDPVSDTDSSALVRTELALTLKDNALYFKGETYPNPNYFSLFSGLNLIDGSRSQVKDIIGNHVAAYVSLCFSSFGELENVLLENYKLNNLKEYKEYERNLNRLNKYLGVNIAELFTSWIGDEIAVVKPAVDKENRLDNLVLAIRSKDIDLAKDQLSYLTEQISRKTPVRFRTIVYNGHSINYLSLKGLFNLFLGSLFKKFDKPYYTIIGDYVVFSNSASTLATMIKDYSLGNTLVQDEKYNEVMDQLGDKNNIYGYISSPEAYEYLYQSLKPEARAEFVKNKGAFQSFESVGFALANAGSAYETRIIASHNVNASADYAVRELSRELEDMADRIESGCYNVVIPDSIAVSTKGDFTYATDDLSFSGHLSNGDPEGIWNMTDKAGLLVAQYTYREGQPRGEARFFYANGVVLAQILYEEDKIKSYKEFFQDGTPKTELEYNKGLRHGDARFYYSTGHLFGEGRYKKGRRVGTWKYYSVTGEVEKKLKF